MPKASKQGKASGKAGSLFIELLDSAVRLQKQVQYKELLAAVEMLRDELGKASEGSPAHFRAKAIVSEVLYYYGRVDEARQVVEDAADIGAGLDQEDLSTLEQRVLVREKVRCFEAYVIAECYSRQLYPEAGKKLEACRDFIERRLMNGGIPAFGLSLLGMTEYYLGRVYRQLGDYDSAKRAFMKAIQHLLARAELKKAAAMDGTAGRAPVAGDKPEEYSVNDGLAFLDHKVAVCFGLGLAWIDFTQARLTDAEQKVTAAKASLIKYEDAIDNAYMDLILGSIARCKADRNIEQLTRAKALVERALTEFIEIKHGWYEPHARFELGQVHLYLALANKNDWGERKKHLACALGEAEKVWKVSTEREDSMWVINSLILQSEIKRADRAYNDARDLATDALKELKEAERNKDTNSLRVCEINALIARAEANLSDAKAERREENKVRLYADSDTPRATRVRIKKALYAAHEDLTEALRLNESFEIMRRAHSQNSRIEALCRLYLARCYAYDGDKRQAEESYRKWLDINEGVEHEKIQSLAKKVRKDINEVVTEFVVSGDGDLRYEELVKRLRTFLLNVARQKHPNDKDKQAELLHVARMTIYNWEKEERDRENAGQELMAGEKHAAKAGTTKKSTEKKGRPAKH
jgi:tetratricopeptide (TPR) repeat protein